MKLTAPLVTVLLASFAATASVAQSQRSPVVVEHIGSDSVGQRLAFELREAIRGSQSMRLVTAKEANPRIVVYLITIETTVSNPGALTSAAMTVAYDSDELDARGTFLTTFVQNCGSKRTQECARDLTARVDEELERLRKSWPRLWSALKR